MNKLDYKQIFENYLTFEKEVIKIFDLSFDSFFPQLLTIIKLRLDIELCVIISENNYFSSLNLEKTEKILDIYKINEFNTMEVINIDSFKYFSLQLKKNNVNLFFCFDHIDPIYKHIFENIGNIVSEIINKDKDKNDFKDLQIKYKAVVDNSRDSMFICDMKANILLVSPVCQEIYGYSVEEFLKDPTITPNMVAEDYKEKFNNFILNFIKGELPKELTEWCWIRKDGQRVYTENSFSMIKNKNDEYIGLQIVARNITDRKLKELNIVERNKLLSVIVENIPAIVWTIDKNGVFLQSFGSALDSLEFKENQLTGMNIRDVYPEHIESVLSTFEKGENRFLAEGETNGKPWCFDNFIFKQKDILVCFSLNITDTVETEKLLKNSLNEKEILIKEIHHRVKNNMQVISSLLSLQSSQIKDKSIRQLFSQSQNRIRSMALAHEILYQTESLSKIDFNKYLHDLTNLLSNSYTTKNITFNINCSNINLDIIKIIPTGLIINEIISNSIKYAFEIEQSDCFINICIKNKEGKIEISIDDNGIGFPKNIDFKNTNSLGLQLVNSLVSQLNGDIKLISEKGTKYIITF